MWIKKYSTIIALIAIAFAIYALAYAYEKTRISAEQGRSLAAHVSELDRQIKQLSFVPKLLADDISIASATRARTTQSITAANRRLSVAQRQSGLEFAFLMDENGFTIASSNWNEENSFVGEDYSFRPYFKGAVLGETSTFFAVGATTGIPGYFIAEPVYVGSQIKGVVVAKTTLSAPLATWRELDFESVVLDEFGVIILASNESFLYQPTRQISDANLLRISNERKYPLSLSYGDVPSTELTRFQWFAKPLQSEPWAFMSMVPSGSYHVRAFFISAVASAASFMAFLLFRIYRQQKHLVSYEQHHSRALEEQVARRTQELEAAQAALISESNYAFLGRMSAAINHEINQPLASLRLNLASLRKLIENPDDSAEDIENIVVESDRTTKRIGLVVTTLRNYARKEKISSEDVDVNTLVNEVAGVIKLERPTKSQCLDVSPIDMSVLIKGDRVLLQQALLNLLYNAIDTVMHHPDPMVRFAVNEPLSGAEIPAGLNPFFSGLQTCGYDDSMSYVAISVEDNGPGISEELIPTLFEPFSNNRGNQNGLGLGLTIAKQIAESHSGFLVYTHLKMGSRFSLVLPVISDHVPLQVLTGKDGVAKYE